MSGIEIQPPVTNVPEKKRDRSPLPIIRGPSDSYSVIDFRELAARQEEEDGDIFDKEESPPVTRKKVREAKDDEFLDGPSASSPPPSPSVKVALLYSFVRGPSSRECTRHHQIR